MYSVCFHLSEIKYLSTGTFKLFQSLQENICGKVLVGKVARLLPLKNTRSTFHIIF